jgi:translation initiation factor 1
VRLFAGTPFDIPPRCERCGQLESECLCTASEKTRIAPEKQTVTVRVEKRKKGKIVTVVRGFMASANDLPSLAAKLKNACGAGGTVEEDTIIIQGDHAVRVRQLLSEVGYRVQ